MFSPRHGSGKSSHHEFHECCVHPTPSVCLLSRYKPSCTWDSRRSMVSKIMCPPRHCFPAPSVCLMMTLNAPRPWDNIGAIAVNNNILITLQTAKENMIIEKYPEVIWWRTQMEKKSLSVGVYQSMMEKFQVVSNQGCISFFERKNLAPYNIEQIWFV